MLSGGATLVRHAGTAHTASRAAHSSAGLGNPNNGVLLAGLFAPGGLYAATSAPHAAAARGRRGGGAFSLQSPLAMQAPSNRPPLAAAASAAAAQHQQQQQAQQQRGMNAGGIGAGSWTADESARLAALVREGGREWVGVAAQLGTGRSTKQCGERYMRLLCPGIKR
jgi:hypothetical protein